MCVSVFCECIFKEQKKKAEKEGEALIKSGRQTARGTPWVFAQLALMDKSITQSFHATSYYPHVRCLEKNLLSQVQEMKVFIKKKKEIPRALWQCETYRRNEDKKTNRQ